MYMYRLLSVHFDPRETCDCYIAMFFLFPPPSPKELGVSSKDHYIPFIPSR